MATSLPVFVALLSKTNQKYLTYVKEGDAHKHLQFSSDEVLSRSTKFAIERSSSNQKLVHIRCCHNNKYLVKKSEGERWIVAAAEKQEEDRSLSTCTLFLPVFAENDMDGRTILQLWHVQTGSYVCSSSSEGVLANSLCVELGSQDQDDLMMTIIDWDTLVVLPKHVAFKAADGKYLRVGTGSTYSCCDDKRDAQVRNDIVTNNDGTICIKNCAGDGFWTSIEGGLVDIASPEKATSKEISKSFMPIKIGKTTIALRCSPLNTFCLRVSEDNDNGSLSCTGNSIVREARFEVEELVISRQVYGVTYHLEDARIYDEATITKATAVATNNTQEIHTATFGFHYQDKTSRRWTNGASLSSGVKMSFSAGIPLITAKGIVILDQDYKGEYEWGETKTETIEIKHGAYSIAVPPMTESLVSLLATTGTCEIPFSYTVRDVRTDGLVVLYAMDDGVFTGKNSYNLRYETETKPLLN